MLDVLKRFLALESASGLILIAVSLLALLTANSPLATPYETLFAPGNMISQSINDGLMCIFFLLIGLEIKRELIEGELAGCNRALLPVVAAMGGVIVPAFIYSYFNADTDAIRGWAIPAATDIVFSLGVLSLFGNRVPLSLKIFLMALAVIDDLIAVVIIALFYTEKLNLVALAAAVGCIGLLHIARIQPSLPVLLLVGACLWICILFSGVHPTIAGVILGLIMPMQYNAMLIEKLHMPVAFFIVPLFAFANAGISFSGLATHHVFAPVSMGIMAGLFFGKPIGIFMATMTCIRIAKIKLPDNYRMSQLWAVSQIAGIGFTMSLFIATLASSGMEFNYQAKLGIIAGSFFSGILGAFMLWLATRKGIKS